MIDPPDSPIALGASSQRDEATRQARQRYQALFERSRDAIVLSDVEGRIVDANPAMCRLAGRSREQLLGLRSVDLAPSFQSTTDVQRLRTELVADGELRGVLPMQRPDGSVVEVEYHAVTDILDGLNMSIMRDVTDQRRVQQELSASEQRFRALAEHAVQGIFRIRLSPERSYAYVNAAFVRITGFTLADLREDPLVLRRRTHPDDTIGDEETDLRRIRFRRRDDSWRWLELRQTAILDDEGTATALQGLVLDVTDQKQQTDALEAALAREHEAADELRHLDELKDGFLRAVSHELRTPLSAIYGFTKTLRDRSGDLDADATMAMLHRIDANAERLRTLLDDLLDINRLTTSSLAPQREPVDLAELAQQVADEVPLGHRTLHLSLEPAPGRLEAARIVRIVHNLLTNVAKHTPEGTRVWVRTGMEADGSATLVVEDDGPGIPPEMHETITDPFVQGPASADAPSPGTGVGLSIVHQFTHMHDGEVEVGERSGGGARFRIWFPATSDPA